MNTLLSLISGTKTFLGYAFHPNVLWTMVFLGLAHWGLAVGTPIWEQTQASYTEIVESR